MTKTSKVKREIINKDALPLKYPTHLHSSEFWEHLGRAFATYGFLEEVLGKAIFAFTGTKEYSSETINEAFEKWQSKLGDALSDPLGPLIDVYAKSVREHQGATIENLPDLVKDLRKAAKLRNVLCHGSWRAPNSEGASVPFYVDRHNMIFQDEVDVTYLEKVQAHVAELACEVINTVTHMGYQFPGGAGSGKPVWPSE